MSGNKCYCSLFVVFALLAAAGSKSNEEKQALLEEKVKTLTELSNKENGIHLNEDKFRHYVKKSPRNYSIIMMLTALAPQRQCSVCMHANDEYKILANSWRSSQQYSNGLFFTVVDYDENQQAFHDMKINSVPVFLHFPATGKRNQEDTFQSRGELKAEGLAAWVDHRTEFRIKVYRPINYTYVGSVVALLAVAGGLLYYLRNKLHVIFGHTCAILILTVIFAMISGHMWNRIRKPPNMVRNHQTGKTMYIHPDRGSQVIMETYLIMLLYSLNAVGFILMNEIQSLKKRWSKNLLALAGLACLIVFFCTLLNVFKIKSPYYPYGFFDLVNDYVWKL